MLNLSQWCYVLKYLGTKKTYKQIEETIKSECLLSPNLFCGAYQIDAQKAWEKLIVAEEDCFEMAKKSRLTCGDDIEPWYEEISYRQHIRSVRSMYRSRRR